MIFEIFVFILCSLALYICYCYKKVHWQFESGGLKYEKGLPLFGNNWRSTFLRRHVNDDFEDIYKAFPGERYVGYTKDMEPIILIRDPKLIKDITIKDFQHLSDRPKRMDTLLNLSIAGARGDDWKIKRSKQSPAFTSNRLKFMMKKMDEIAQEVVQRLKCHSFQDLDISLSIRRYCVEGTTYSAFNIRDSKEKEDKENIFVKVTSNSGAGITLTKSLILSIILSFPRMGMIFKKVRFEVFRKKMVNFYTQTTKEAIKRRKESNVNLQDYIQVLTQIHSNDEWSIEEITAQVLIAFSSSSNQTPNNLCLLFLELALNPEIQEKLYQEVRRYKEAKGDLTFDGLRDLKYMNCVLNESLRKYAPVAVMERVCTKPYLLPPPREGAMPYLLKPGNHVYCLCSILHKDPNYFPKPEVFDPERFSDENKHKIQQGTFIPFGMGPRVCFGERYARTQMLVIIYYMVLNFKIQKCEKTSDPIRIKPDPFMVKSMSGTWVRLEAR